MKTLILAGIIAAFAPTAAAQNSQVHWHRSEAPAPANQRVFHSVSAINLPTAETLQKGLWQFEISHRFIPRFSDGRKVLYGLDGPVNMRLGLDYAISDHLGAALGRSNLNDNVDFQLKYAGLHLGTPSFPVRAGLQAGIAWNTEHPLWSSSDGRSWQYYAQAIANTRIGNRLALGVVPTYVYNAILESNDVEHVLALGLYGQYYFHPVMALIAEWNITERGYYYHHDAVSFGLQLETGGHFFKIVATNSTALNTSQYAIGTTQSFDPKNWHLGFNITRLLKF